MKFQFRIGKQSDFDPRSFLATMASGVFVTMCGNYFVGVDFDASGNIPVLHSTKGYKDHDRIPCLFNSNKNELTIIALSQIDWDVTKIYPKK